MTINTGVKGTLAKLLATEDIVVEHRKCETAQFDVERRVLTLPIWEKASENVYDMLVAHEVGHALFTPNEDWTEKCNCPQSFINVVEDARIEKLMKRKYAGLPKTFFRGYEELNEQDFFDIEGDANKFEFIDKINLYFKIGNFTYVSFTDEEQALVDRVGAAEDFDTVLKVSDDIFEYMKGQLEDTEEEDEDAPESPFSFPQQGSQEGEGEGEESQEGEATEEEVEQTPDQEIINPNQPWDKKEGDVKSEATVGGSNGSGASDEHGISSLEARTDATFNKKIADYVQTGGYETEYVEIPRLDPKTLVIDWKEILKVNEDAFVTRDASDLDRNADEWRVRSYLRQNEQLIKSENDYKEFYRESQKEVNYLVKEFEMRKSAGAYARASTSKTGVLDTTKLFQYKYNEDLFKKVTVLPDGKNHGMIFILDWSGSMSNCLMDTVKQVLQLAYFCNKVSIPFTVLAFGYNYHGFRQEEDKDRFTNPNQGDLSFGRGFCLMEMLTSDVNKKDFHRLALGLWRNAGCNSYLKGGNRWGREYDLQPSGAMGLSGTPLIESIAAMHSVIPHFIKKTGAEKVSISVLTDGESACASYYTSRKAIYDGRLFENSFGYNCQLRDRKRGKLYAKKDNPSDQVNTMLENLKDNFPQISLLGFRLVTPRDANGFFRLSQYMGYFKNGIDEVIKVYRKQKFYEFTESPYDKLFVMPINNTDEVDLMDELDEGATKGQISTAFKKMFKNKRNNKKMLTSFAQTVG